MKNHSNTKQADDRDTNRRPPFNKIDWIIAAFSIILLVVILLNLPAY